MFVIHARIVYPVTDTPIIEGAVAVDGAQIVAVGAIGEVQRQFPHAEPINLSECMLLPGLVNAHTHLELSDMKGAVPYQGSFTDWVRRLTVARQERTAGRLEEIIAGACRESLRTGVTTAGDICYEHRAWPFLARAGIRKTCFAEAFGLGGDLGEVQYYLQGCIEQTQCDDLLRLGLSPHAPYSAGPGVYRLAGELAAGGDLALTTHLAETEAEIEFLKEGTGPWVDYLKQIDRWDGSFECPGRRPVEYFLDLDMTERPCLLAHVNYITDEELDRLAGTGHSVVYCPRSHAFFGHRDHPFRKMLQRGINVCLGTDSLASNSTLSVLDEMRFLHEQFPDFPSTTLIQMGTVNGAKALGWDDRIGGIEIGKEADLIAIPLRDIKADDPLEDILLGDMQPRMMMVRGEIQHG